jgi:hypothetical protein
LNRIKEVKYFSVMFDETTDVSTISQLSMVMTYGYEKKDMRILKIEKLDRKLKPYANQL